MRKVELVAWNLVEFRGIASPKSHPRVCSMNSDQDGGPFAKTGEGNDPAITATCHCSSRVFSAPARGTRSRVLLLEREHSSLQEDFPLYTVLPKRRGEGRKGGMR